jgi:hypothetical protein
MTRGESTPTSEQAGVNLRALRCGTGRTTDNEDSEYFTDVTESQTEVRLQDYFSRFRRRSGRAPSESRLVSQGLPACKSANRNAPEGEAPSRHRRGARVRGSEAQPPCTDGTVWLSSRLSKQESSPFVISRFRFFRVPFGAPFVPNRSGTRNPKTPPEDGAPLVPAPRFPKRDVYFRFRRVEHQTPRQNDGRDAGICGIASAHPRQHSVDPCPVHLDARRWKWLPARGAREWVDQDAKSGPCRSA